MTAHFILPSNSTKFSIASLRATHIIHSNRESGEGYPDVLIYPLADNQKHDLGIVMEFKHAKEDGSENQELLAEKALSQIEQKKYITELKSQSQVKRILKLGLAFNHKCVIVKHHLQRG
jgi:hypothetical protein